MFSSENFKMFLRQTFILFLAMNFPRPCLFMHRRNLFMFPVVGKKNEIMEFVILIW